MRKRILMALIVLIALGMIWLFVEKSVLVVKYVTVNGDSGMTSEDVIRTAGVEFGASMRSVNTEQIARSVERSGLLRCVSVELEYPSTIVIDVERRVGRMAIEYGGSIALLDGEGYVISISREMPDGDFIYVTGHSARDAVVGRQLTADKSRVSAMCAVVNAIYSCGADEYVSEVNVENINAIYFYSRTGIQVSLGDSERLDSKIIWAKYALMDLEANGNTSGHLDVTSGSSADFRAE